MSFVCTQCPRQCGTPRNENDASTGICGMPSNPVVARAALHFGEEPCISGKNGSGTVFFSGCSLGCRYCQNTSISHKRFGKPITAERLADIFKELEESGAHNINLVNPTHFTHAICKALSLYKPNIPVIFNSSGYERVETLQSLEGLIDVYLPDCKYVSSDVSAALSYAADYFEYAEKAICEMARQTGPVRLDRNGLIQHGTIVRHLVLPSHTNESKNVLDFLAQIKDRVWVSLMFQYTPMGEAKNIKRLDRTLTKRECEKVLDYMLSLGITDGYVQSRDSAGIQMIPDFDLTGV